MQLRDDEFIVDCGVSETRISDWTEVLSVCNEECVRRYMAILDEPLAPGDRGGITPSLASAWKDITMWIPHPTRIGSRYIGYVGVVIACSWYALPEYLVLPCIDWRCLRLPRLEQPLELCSMLDVPRVLGSTVSSEKDRPTTRRGLERMVQMGTGALRSSHTAKR